MVGINAAIVGTASGNAGIGFAIAGLRADLIQKYHLPPGQSGAVVTRIDANSAAEHAGLKTGDLLTALNGSQVKDAADLRNKLGVLRVGEMVELTGLRNDKAVRIHATLTEPATKLLEG